ncbi:hypothetical protein, partial [Pseudomonas fluvialis]|uniref:hypothetical protein n=1 Tax=Pseudomonas fluvialis TaxID=1793966 RepID=UPI001A9C7E5C
TILTRREFLPTPQFTRLQRGCRHVNASSTKVSAALCPTSIQLLGDFQSAAASNDVVLSQFVLAG